MVAEDTDILVLLIHHTPSAASELFLTTSKGTYNVTELFNTLNDNEKKRLLFIHAFTGCDTVSAIYRHTKVSLFNKLCSDDEDLEDEFTVLMSVESLQEDIMEEGVMLFQYIYGDIDKTLTELRVAKYSKLIISKTLKPEALPPTEGAAKQHTLRAKLQFQDWDMLSTMTLPPTVCGWKVTDSGQYTPIGSSDLVAPDQILKLTACNYQLKSKCKSARCSCRIMGMKCIEACGNCNGVECDNSGHVSVEAEQEDENM